VSSCTTSHCEAAGNCIPAAELRGAASSRGGETLPGAPWPTVLGSTLVPLFLATLERGGVGNPVLSADSNLASRRSIALVSKCSSGLPLAASRCVTSPCMAWVSKTSVGSSDVAEVCGCSGVWGAGALGSEPASEVGATRGWAVGRAISSVVRLLPCKGLDWCTGVGPSCRTCHGANHRLTSSARAAEQARAHCHAWIRLGPLNLAIML